MTQNELNQKFAEAYGVGYQRYEPIELRMSPNNIILRKDKFIPIHTDTLTLLQLCIEHNLRIGHFPTSVVVDKYPFGLDFGFAVVYDAHLTKEATTCAAMFSALCKLKNIGGE